MRKHDFINRLSEEAAITIEEASVVNDIMENHSIIGKNSKRMVESEISEALNVSIDEGVRISDIASGIIASEIKKKVLHPFGA